MAIITLSIIAGIIRRFYGAEKPWFPSDLNRLFGYAVPLAIVSMFFAPLPGSIGWSAAIFGWLIVAHWGGISLVDYDKYWRVETPQDWRMMAWNGSLLMLPAGVVLLLASFLPGNAPSAWHAILWVFSGILMAPGYWFGWRMPTLNKEYLNRGTEWGEILGHAFIFGFIGVARFLLM